MGYVGRTEKKRSKRDKQHKESIRGPFEVALMRDYDNNWENWEVITLCQFESQVETAFTRVN
jgi:hypothetical protein